jgi:hypothetical protein
LHSVATYASTSNQNVVCQYSSSNNTGNTSIVKHTILEAPVFFIQQYCDTNIVKHTILETLVFFIQQYWIPFANFGSRQYSILKLIAIHNLACSYVISAVHNIRGKSPVMSKYFVWSLKSLIYTGEFRILEFPVWRVLQY